ncbi:carbohydrate ABC transporter permease [Vibrio sp. SCSIO 43140]|uniref:carbohydrate ABC transporter permease n=1 Tax=Vibrio sp. SCSIO 43140 TaxID=2819100 RepID=UPI0020759499|nr:carbohydrate ABC transporter permease [Vibrio sp. SCSIO 43140]USD62511.1 carbohydrate ABC transporter permease [Vibrio sp. SCSIO 43140]
MEKLIVNDANSPQMNRSQKHRQLRRFPMRKLNKTLLSSFMIAVVVLILSPVFYMIAMSFRSRKEIMLDPLGLPTTLHLSNYAGVIEDMNYYGTVLNTIGITIASILCVSLISSLAAYPLARIRNRITSIVYIFFVIGMIIPPFAALTPLYLFMRDLGLLDSYIGLILVYTVGNLPLGVFFYTSFMKAIPKELEEAARLDGASFLKTYWYIIFPMLKPITGTLAIFVTLSVWNDVVNPLLFITTESKLTIMPAVLRFLGTYSVDPTQLFPAAVLASLPLLCVFFALSKQIVSGMTAGAVK